MHPTVQAHFDALIARFPPPGDDVLEIGAHATSSPGFLRALGGRHLVGLSLDQGGIYEWGEIVEGDANRMDFADDSFDAVICNAMLEHDRYFWMSLAEVRRVLRPGGLFYCGVPGYGSRAGKRRASAIARIKNRLGRVAGPLDPLFERAQALPTFPIHERPGDYYRFTERAVREVFFDGFHVLDVTSVMTPPRWVGVGRKDDSVRH